MPSSRTLAHARRIEDRIVRGLAEDVRRLREDAGLTRAMLADAAGVDRTFLGRIEDGHGRASLRTYVRVAVALGADVSARLYPNTGPSIRDRHQARMLEALLARLDPRWRRYTEVAVRQPARGWIDVVLHDPTSGTLVAVEIQSSLPRVEQLIRWAAEKATSLPSWEGFAELGEIRQTSTLLMVRSTRTTRQIGREFARQLEIAYPAHPADGLDALTGPRPWPGAALIWVDLRAGVARFDPRRAPRWDGGAGSRV